MSWDISETNFQLFIEAEIFNTMVGCNKCYDRNSCQESTIESALLLSLQDYDYSRCTIVKATLYFVYYMFITISSEKSSDKNNSTYVSCHDKIPFEAASFGQEKSTILILL